MYPVVRVNNIDPLMDVADSLNTLQNYPGLEFIVIFSHGLAGFRSDSSYVFVRTHDPELVESITYKNQEAYNLYKPQIKSKLPLNYNEDT